MASSYWRPADILDGGYDAWTQAGGALVRVQIAAARRGGAHRLGYPRAPEGRSHRLPMADPSLRRSDRRLSVRRTGGGSASPNVLAALPSISKAPFGAIAATAAPSIRCSTSGASPSSRCKGSGSHRARRGYGAARSCTRGGGTSCRFAWAIAHVSRRSRPARSRTGALRRLLSMVSRCDRRAAQLAGDQIRKNAMNAPTRIQAARSRRLVARGVGRLDAHRPAELWRSRRPDRADAQGSGRG